MKKIVTTLGLLFGLFGLSQMKAEVPQDRGTLFMNTIHSKYRKAFALSKKDRATITKSDIAPLLGHNVTFSDYSTLHDYMLDLEKDISTAQELIEYNTTFAVRIGLKAAIPEHIKSSLLEIKTDLELWQNILFNMYATELLVQEGRITRSSQKKWALISVLPYLSNVLAVIGTYYIVTGAARALNINRFVDPLTPVGQSIANTINNITPETANNFVQSATNAFNATAAAVNANAAHIQTDREAREQGMNAVIEGLGQVFNNAFHNPNNAHANPAAGNDAPPAYQPAGANQH